MARARLGFWRAREQRSIARAPELAAVCRRLLQFHSWTHMFTNKFFSLFYFRPNMVFLGHFVPPRSVNTYISSYIILNHGIFSVCCCQGIALRAQVFNKRIWLLHVNSSGAQHTACDRRVILTPNGERKWCLSSNRSWLIGLPVQHEAIQCVC